MKVERLVVGVGEARRSMHHVANVQVSFSDRVRIAKEVVLGEIAMLLGDLFPKLLSKFDDLYLFLRRNAQRRAATEHRQFRLLPDLRVKDVTRARGPRCCSLDHFRFLSRQDVLHCHAAPCKPHHLPHQSPRLFMLALPCAVDGPLTCQAAVLVLASAPAGTGVVSTNLRAGLGSHDTATLPRTGCGRQGGGRKSPAYPGA